MSVFARILVAVGDHDLSRPALQMAIRLAKDQAAVLRLVHVVESVPPRSSSARELEETESRLREDGDALLRELSAHATAQGIQTEATRLKIGTLQESVAEAIAGEALDSNADLVITGTHARKGIVRWLAGSVAESLARTSPVPVMIVRDSETD